MALDPPPNDAAQLAGFPALPADASRPMLHRVFRPRDPATGRARGPFFFASAQPEDGTGGRFDLPAPYGSCYLSTTPSGAWLEVFRGTALVALPDVRARRLLTTRPPRPLRAADLTAKAARGFGVTLDVSTGDDYALPRRWAARLREAGFRALHSVLRHDPSGQARSVTLLDAAGEHAPYGWRWRTSVARLETEVDLLTAVRAFGSGIADVPYDVPISDPPSRG